MLNGHAKRGSLVNLPDRDDEVLVDVFFDDEVHYFLHNLMPLWERLYVSIEH